MSAKRKTLDALFTTESLMSLQGAAAATLLVPNVLTYLIGASFRPYEKWVALGVALLISMVITSQAPSKEWTKWVIAVLNGLLIFSAAVGLTEALGTNGVKVGAGVGPDEPVGRLPFFHSWYP